MSLVSIRHLAAPFRNSVHWVTILLLSLAFMVLRMSGVAIDFGSGSELTRDTESSKTIDLPPEVEDLRRAKVKAPAASSEDTDLVDKILEPVRKDKQEKARRKEEEQLKHNDAGKLEEIERMLGLR